MDFFTEPIKGAASKLGELGVESIVKQFKYLIKHKQIIANMNEELDKLKALKQTLQGWADTESRRGHEIPPIVQKWLSSVTSIENKLQREDDVKKNKKCFGAQCPDLVGNYSLGKRTTEKIEEIMSLKEEGSKLPRMSYPKAPPPLGSTFTEDIKSLESRSKIIAKVIEKLKDDKSKRISICGMGGVGKTTLVKELIKTIENKLFGEVVMVTVSENPDYEKIQRQIDDGLGLELKRQSMEGRGREILQRLKEMDDKKVKVLIVLDDVWNELNFEWIGLPSLDHQKDIKILFTSRNVEVCKNMKSQENFEVSVLLEDEAWRLFREMAGDVVDKPDINPIAREVAKECGGLPLAIVTFGRTLGNKEKNMWEVALQQLRNSQSSSFSDKQEYVYSRIKLSFNFLGSEEQSCLFLCGLFPEDFDIPIESLLRHGVGLGLFEAVDAVWKARNRVNYLVNNLKRCFLLLDSEKPGCVKMHDVVRDVVLKSSYEAEHGIFVQSDAELKRLKKKQGKWRRMSLILDEKIELENGLECPSLELLQVQSQSKKEDLISWLENFICRMSKLTVLVMQNLCIPKASSLLYALVNLHTLQLEGCDVGDISVIGNEFNKLEILSFANSNIKELPVEIGQLGSLRLLDLTDCDHLNFISANVFAKLSRLEELYFRVENFPWLLNEDALKELRNLSQKLKVLEIKVRKVDILPNDLIFKNLEKFWVYVVPYASYERHGYLESNIIQLRAVDFNSIKSNLMTMLLVKKCEILILEKVKNLKNVIYELDGSGLQYVKDLRLDSCPNLECVIDCCTPCCAFPLIKSMSLKNLTKLREILHASDHHEIEKSVIEFSELEKLELASLPNLIGFSNAVDLNEPHQPIHHGSSSTTKFIDSTNKEDGEISSRSHLEPVGGRPSSISAKLFSSNWMKQFPKLETILLWDCSSLEMVFDLEGYSESSAHAADLLFPQLRNINISRLKDLSYVWGNVPQCVRGFQNVRFLTISACGSLKHVFTSAIVREMKNLEELEISYCESIENLVVWSRDDEWDDNKGHKKNIGFNKLHYLSLSSLPKLVSICSDALELECPSLGKFEISNCPMLEISLLPTHIHAKQDNVDVTYSANTKDVWGNVQDRVRGFQNLRFLTISNCDSLKYVFTLAIVRAITNLEELKVSSCKLIENIVYWSRNDEEDGNSVPVTNIEFKKLYYLSLSRLPKLAHICSDSLEFECPTLKRFEISDCPMLDISLLPAHMDAKPDIEVTHSANTKDNGLHSFNENNSRSSTWPHGCTPFLPKFICKGNTDKRNSKEVSPTPTQDHIPSDFELKSRKEKCHIPTLEDLYVIQCNSLDELFYLEEKSSFSVPSHLKTIKIEKCDKLRSIVARRGEKKDMISCFTQVESLHLEKLPNLMWHCFSGTYESRVKQEDLDEREGDHHRIRHHPFMDESLFPNLTYLVIKACNRICILFSPSSLSSLEHLEKLEVSLCENMEEIISQEETEARANTITFPRLQHVILEGLTNLKAFWLGSSYNFSLPSLQKVKIKDCPNMEVFSRGFCNTPQLEDVAMEVESVTVSSSYIEKKDLNDIVQGFKALVASRGSEMLNWTKIHYQLQVMRLENLPKLSHIWKHNIAEVVSFQKLTYIRIERCHKLRSLLSHSMARSLVQLQTLDVARCDKMKEIVTREDCDTEGGNKIKVLLFPKLKGLYLVDLPVLECFSSGDYDYDIPLCNVGEDMEINHNNHNDDKVQISFPQLKELVIRSAPNLKCFCSGAYDYNIMLSSIEECPNIATFPRGNVIVSTPNLINIRKRRYYPLVMRKQFLGSWSPDSVRTLGDLNLTIHYIQNSEKYKAELRKLETFRDIEQDERLVGYIKRETELDIERCHKLLSCIPSNTVHLFSHVVILRVRECECLKEIFESNHDCEGGSKNMDYESQTMRLVSLPKLKHIRENHGQLLGLQNLKKLTIKQCHDLRYVFLDVSMATSLPNLYELNVYECNKMEEIIRNPISVKEQQEAKIRFPSLYQINLKSLPSLKCFCRSSFPCYVELPQCGWITIEDCPEMKTFWDNGTLYTPRLYYLLVENNIFDGDEGVNEVVIRHHNKLVSRHVLV